MTDYLGQKLDNYRLPRLLGTGGFAEVYLGEHVRLGMQAAIKVLHTRLVGADFLDQYTILNGHAGLHAARADPGQTAQRE